jgi:pyruvate dehydrogenase E2 component (dihydrolipoamide acetyltransferase)
MVKRIQPFTMPKWGIEMEEGVIREWHVNEGDTLKEGDLFAVIETDKIANDVELEFSGTLRRLVGKAEETYPVGALIAVFANPDVPESEIDDFVANFKGVDAGFAHGENKKEPAAAAPASPSKRATTIPGGISISPKALDLAEALGVDLSGVTGSGRGGRLSLQDVEQAAKAQGLSGDVTEGGAENPFKTIKLSTMRKTIAKRLVASTTTIPHFYLRMRISMDALEKARAEAKRQQGKAPSVNDYLIKACAKALIEVPEANVHFLEDEIRQFAYADISVAVAVEGGLVTPIIRRADQKTVAAIAAEMKELAARARLQKLEQREYQGGTFSLSNLGMYGVSSFDAVINPPMGAILAAGAIERAPKEHGGFESVMTVTLSCDHRVIDGALGGRFLGALKLALESPGSL